MSLFSIIALSSLVSIGTIVVLCARKTNPKLLPIPSWFYGSPSAQAAQRIKWSVPPLVTLLAVIIFTVGLAMLFQPPLPQSLLPERNKTAIVWVDNSFSAYLSRQQNQVKVANIAQQIWDLGLQVKVIQTRVAGSYPFRVSIDLADAKSTSELTTLLQDQWHVVLPFAAPLTQAIWKAKIKKKYDKFVVISDGHSETLKSLNFAKPSFTSGIYLDTGSPQSFSGEQSELIPVELAQLWTSAQAIKTGNTGSKTGDHTTNNNSSNNPNDKVAFQVFDHTLQSIPEQARPGIFVEKIRLEQNKPGLTIVAPKSIQNLGHSHFRNLPLITLCGSGVGGPAELDPAADLKAFANFFQIPIRMESCLEDSIEQTTQSESSNAWQFRKQSLWIVPLTDQVYGSMINKASFWIPRGFEPCCDYLVYAAALRPADAESVPTQIFSVQLDANALPVPIPLIPEPPKGTLQWPIVFSSAENLALNADQQSSSEMQPTKAESLIPIFTAAGGENIAYRGLNSNVYYVRTSLTMPNGELGRSAVWSQVWLDILRKSAEQMPPNVKIIAPESPDDLPALNPLNFAEKLNLETYVFEASEQRKKAEEQRDMQQQQEQETSQKPDKISNNPSHASNSQHYLWGIYRRQKPQPEKDKIFYLLTVSPLERSQTRISPAEFTELFNPQPTAAQGSGAPAPSAPQHLTSELEKTNNSSSIWHSSTIKLSCLLLLISLLALWFWPFFFVRNSINKEKYQKLFLAITIFLIPYYLESSHAKAQNPTNLFFGKNAEMPKNLDTAPNIPFRIAWCDNVVPSVVKENYSKLRALLASRGTIELPIELTANGCRPGGAEIWWTNDLSALPLQQLLSHVHMGGAFVIEGNNPTARQADNSLSPLLQLSSPAVGLKWEPQLRRGLLYRSFYLLQTFDNCPNESTWLFTLKKKLGAESPLGIVTPTRFLSEGGDCFAGDNDMRQRAFINLIYAFLTTDYKLDQLQLPEILNRVRKLGLEP